MVYMTFNEKLMWIYEKTKIPVRRLAQRAGINQNTYEGYVHRGSVPSAPNGLKIARSLDVTMDWLFDETISVEDALYRDPEPWWVAEIQDLNDLKADYLAAKQRILSKHRG